MDSQVQWFECKMKMPTMELESIMLMNFLIMLLIPFSSGQPDIQYLIFTSPEGKGQEPGVYTGLMDFSSNRSNAMDLYEMGETCLMYSDRTSDIIIYPIQPIVMSYDPISEQLTMRTTAPYPQSDMSRITMSIGPLCQSQEYCQTSPQAFIWNSYSPLGTLGPFVVYENQLYYLIEHSPNLNKTDYTDRHVIELFLMEDCQSMLPRKNSSIELTQCSRDIAVVFNETYSEDTCLVMGNHMPMVIITLDRVFLFVLFKFHNKTFGENVNCPHSTTAQLYSVYESGNAELLHEIPLTKCWSPENITIVPGMGSVSYYPDEICWSVVEGIWCGRWDSKTFTDVLQVLKADDVPSICGAAGSADTEEKDHGDVILTGVVIYQSLHSTLPSNLSLYFGCELASRTRGGSGWLWMSDDRNTTTVAPLLSGGEPVWAGALHLTPSLSQNCDDDDGDDGNGDNNTGITSFTSSFLLVVGPIFAFVICNQQP